MALVNRVSNAAPNTVRPKRDEVWLVALDPAHEYEMQKTRPSLVISPDEMNGYLGRVIIAPMTTSIRAYPTRVKVRFQGKPGQVALDQLRAADRQRLVKLLGTVSAKTAEQVSATLVEMFARR
jgi:mRNA interferase MazF